MRTRSGKHVGTSVSGANEASGRPSAAVVSSTVRRDKETCPSPSSLPHPPSSRVGGEGREIEAHAEARLIQGLVQVPTRVRSRRNTEHALKAEDEAAVEAGGPSAAAAAAGSAFLLQPFHALPAYLKDNEYIRGHYRTTMRPWDSVRSIFGLHNETGNIYSHLLGFFLFLSLTFYVARLPPAPLAFGHHQIDLLWHSVQGGLQGASHMLQEGLRSELHHLQHLGEAAAERVHRVQEGLSGQVQELGSRVHLFGEAAAEQVHHLGEAAAEKVHRLQEDLSEGFRRQQRSFHPISDASAAYHDALESMRRLLQWPTARWPTFVFMAGAMICLLLSSTCHLLGCCQKHITMYVWRLDYVGIAVLIVSSFYPFVYYSFMCNTNFRLFYLASTTVFGFLVIAITLLDEFQKREWRHVRAGLFSVFGLYGLVPVFHSFAINHDIPIVRTALSLILVMGVLYLSGGAIFALRIPERFFPGRFDLFFNSHQIWHLLVVAAALLHYRACMLLLEWRDASGGCALPVTHGSVSGLMRDMEDLGQEVLSLEQVMAKLGHYVREHLMTAGGMAMAGGGALGNGSGEGYGAGRGGVLMNASSFASSSSPL